jgi:hypothetical protein
MTENERIYQVIENIEVQAWRQLWFLHRGKPENWSTSALTAIEKRPCKPQRFKSSSNMKTCQIFDWHLSCH